MEIRGSDEDDPNLTKDFSDWERVAAELPQAYATPPGPPASPSGHDEEVSVDTATLLPSETVRKPTFS